MFAKLRASEWLIGLSVVLLFGATFKPWFKLPGREATDAMPIGGELVGDLSVGIGLNVWDLSFTRWFVYLSLLSASLLIIAVIFGETVHYAIVMATPTVIFSLIASVGLVVRLIWPPGTDSEILGVPPYDVQAQTAFYVAVAGSLLIFLAAYRSMRDEYVPPGYEPAPAPEHITLKSSPLDSAP